MEEIPLTLGFCLVFYFKIFIHCKIISNRTKFLPDETTSVTINGTIRYRNKLEEYERQSFSSPPHSFVEWANFQKLLNQDPEALYRSEQGKILTVLWNSETGQRRRQILRWRQDLPIIRWDDDYAEKLKSRVW